MKPTVYTVKIPNIKINGYEERTFYCRDDVCDYLQITHATLYGLIKNTLKYKHADTRRLKGIVIETMAGTKPVEASANEKTDEQEQLEFFEFLIQKPK